MKIVDKLKGQIRDWLGLDKMERDFSEMDRKVASLQSSVRYYETWLGEESAITAVGIDHHMRGPGDTLFIVCSRLKGGMVKIIPAQVREVNDLMRVIEDLEYSFEPKAIYFDGVPGLDREVNARI